MEVLIAIIGVVGAGVGTFITGYIVHKRKIKAERLAREKKAAAERLAREEEAAERLAREEKKREFFTNSFDKNLKKLLKLLNNYKEGENERIIYYFCIYICNHWRLNDTDNYSIKLLISDSQILQQIKNKMDEIYIIIDENINISFEVVGECMMNPANNEKPNHNYGLKKISGLHHQSVGDGNTLIEKNRKRVYDKAKREIYEFLRHSEEKILLKQKFKELSDILDSI